MWSMLSQTISLISLQRQNQSPQLSATVCIVKLVNIRRTRHKVCQMKQPKLHIIQGAPISHPMPKAEFSCKSFRIALLLLLWLLIFCEETLKLRFIWTVVSRGFLVWLFLCRLHVCEIATETKNIAVSELAFSLLIQTCINYKTSEMQLIQCNICFFNDPSRCHWQTCFCGLTVGEMVLTQVKPVTVTYCVLESGIAITFHSPFYQNSSFLRQQTR